ncbi:GntP family permease [Gimesia maris]|uniref:Inner membrane permease YgbN n=1 Tax=Gimesia maris TaxID=122 RepID=A0ABX5YRS4_9PLAN|nr:GntP family permease [Gimesia maris]EDL61977.1 gluconate permease gntP [Gimesia maris DSM 8797]QEG18474.1 Inner membrane permease YgbN [Gimesia maris]QGQ28556.1 GntP family permease [Gimesia maris]|tara:strand:+ start:253377 stop:255080 length:1704 start_codon:yes stop_codon:yes gene_type:complete
MELSAWVIIVILSGVAIVIGGVLFFRLHAFLALLAGAICVGVLTPVQQIEETALRKNSFKIIEVSEDNRSLVVQVDKKGSLQTGMMLMIMGTEQPRFPLIPIAQTEVQRVTAQFNEDNKRISIAELNVRDDSASRLIRLDDFAITPTHYNAAIAEGKKSVGERVAAGFGSTCAKIGILIALAAIIGMCLLESGAAERIVRSAIQFVGEKLAPVAFMASGFLLAIPVFFDTVFYLLIPLGKAMRIRTGKNYLLYVLAIVTGGTMAHSLVPPTPGPLFVAEQLNVDIATMMMGGLIVGSIAALFGLGYATLINKHCELPFRDSADVTQEDLQKLATKKIEDLPPLWLSLLPILLPVVLIAGSTLLKFKTISSQLSEQSQTLITTLGNKNIALGIATVIALWTLIRQKKSSMGALSESIQTSLYTGGVIILITAAGGAFGSVLQQTGVSFLIESLPQVSPLMLVTLAFLITTAIRTAQGSSTVAMITTVGILGGIAESTTLGFHPVYLALAIGCGSKPISWMNDSGFWVIGKMSGMTEGETLKFISPMTALMGIVGFIVVLLGVQFFPMA